MLRRQVTHHETEAVIHEVGAVLWRSHMDAAIHLEHRLNPDHPAEDHRDGSAKPVSVTPWCGAREANPAYAHAAVA